MAMKLEMRGALAAACLALTLVAAPARADVAMVTGEQWTTSSDAVKKAYLVGLANMVQAEVAYHGRNPPSDEQSFVPRLARGMQGQSVDSVRMNLDKWYAANPTRLKRPVLDIIWFEMAVPGMKK